MAEFDQGGVVGTIVFTLLENGSTQINSSFTSGNFSGWHVHLYPVDYTDDPATRCSPQGTGPHYDPTGRLAAAGSNENYAMVCNMSYPLMCEAGDFSGKFGPLEIGEFSFIDSDPILQLMGKYGIIGRSVVIHAPDTSRIACANIIVKDDTPQIFVATFLGPVAGSIYFRSGTKPDVDTFIYAKLFYTDGRTVDTEDHMWGIYNNELVRLHPLFASLLVQSCRDISPCIMVNVVSMNYRCVVVLKFYVLPLFHIMSYMVQYFVVLALIQYVVYPFT